MNGRIETVTHELAKIGDEANSAFGNLTVSQLNWKANEKSWSVAQCLDHLITTHGLYFPLFEKLTNGGVSSTFWEKHSPLSGFFGRFLIKGLDPKNQKKMKAPGKASPSLSDLDGEIVSRFCEHQDQMIDHLRKLPANIDPARTIITSPLLGLVTYSLDDTFTIIDVHCKRHLGQAMRVKEADGFPA